MRKALIVILLCLMLPVCGSSYCYAQEKDWDKILDKYESLCESCLGLKMKAEAGEKVSRTAISSLFSSLSDLRAELRGGSGSMTDSQRRRFDRIKSRYASIFGVEESPAAEPDERPEEQAERPEVKLIERPEVRPTLPQPRRQKEIIEVKTEENEVFERPVLAPLPQPCGISALAITDHFPALIPASGSIQDAIVPGKRKLGGSVLAVMSVWPELSYGASFSLFEKGCGWGGYVKFHSNFKSDGHSYNCNSDGSWDGGKIWPSGKSSVSCLQASAGMRKNFSQWCGMVAGTGYGKKTLLWEDVDHSWAKVKDKSVSGILLECGPVAYIGPLEIQAVLSTISFRTVAIEFAIGFRF